LTKLYWIFSQQQAIHKIAFTYTDHPPKNVQPTFVQDSLSSFWLAVQKLEESSNFCVHSTSVCFILFWWWASSGGRVKAYLCTSCYCLLMGNLKQIKSQNDHKMIMLLEMKKFTAKLI
jgi:hypothetical protein